MYCDVALISCTSLSSFIKLDIPKSFSLHNVFQFGNYYRNCYFIRLRVRSFGVIWIRISDPRSVWKEPMNP